MQDQVKAQTQKEERILQNRGAPSDNTAIILPFKISSNDQITNKVMKHGIQQSGAKSMERVQPTRIIVS